MVLSVDPPITAVEREFLRELRQYVAKCFFVINKVDYLSPSDTAQAVDSSG